MNSINTKYIRAPIKAETGIVNIHAHIMFRAIYHLTEVALLVKPTPTIDPTMTWVVDTGIPNNEQNKMVAMPEVSAQKPFTGFNFVIFIPTVFTTRQPPNKVPNPIVV